MSQINLSKSLSTRVIERQGKYSDVILLLVKLEQLRQQVKISRELPNQKILTIF